MFTGHLNIYGTTAIRRLPADPAGLRKEAIFCRIVSQVTYAPNMNEKQERIKLSNEK